MRQLPDTLHFLQQFSDWRLLWTGQEKMSVNAL
jgi:hypothetical protein